tara:strand:+ start:127 stop:297 length:171 start_codon:yes stop_codon:yes gene_type:complete
MKTVRDRLLNIFKISISFVSIPSRGVMNANKKQIEVRKNKKNTKNTTEHKRNRKAE